MINIHGSRLSGGRSRGWLRRVYIDGVDLCESFLPIPTLQESDPIHFLRTLPHTHTRVDRSRLERSRCHDLL